MKRVYIALLAIFGLVALAGNGFCEGFNSRTEWSNESNSAFAPTVAGKTTCYYFITNEGDIMPGRNALQDVGSPTQTWRNFYVSSLSVKDLVAETLSVSSGIVNIHETFLQINTSAQSSIGTVTFDTHTFTSTGAVLTPAMITQSTVPRNVIAITTFTGASHLEHWEGTLIVYGTDSKGMETVESITVTTSVLSGVGKVAFSYISSMTISASSVTILSANVAILWVGFGNAIGLANIPATNGVYKVNEGGQDVQNAVVDEENGTINFVTDPNDVYNYDAWYNAVRRWKQ